MFPVARFDLPLGAFYSRSCWFISVSVRYFLSRALQKTLKGVTNPPPPFCCQYVQWSVLYKRCVSHCGRFSRFYYSSDWHSFNLITPVNFSLFLSLDFFFLSFFLSYLLKFVLASLYLLIVGVEGLTYLLIVGVEGLTLYAPCIILQYVCTHRASSCSMYAPCIILEYVCTVHHPTICMHRASSYSIMHRESSYNMYINQQDAKNSYD